MSDTPKSDPRVFFASERTLLGWIRTGIAVATVQHGRFIATLPAVDRPAEYSRGWALWLAGMLSLVSVMLALYLAFVPA